MRNIMFNDKYGLTQAVLQGRKTMTRRVVPNKYIYDLERGLNGTTLAKAYLDGRAYKIGEVVAVAQSYKSVFEESLNYALPRYHWLDDHIDEKGYANKMFVRADLMPHQIKITDIKVERLQDISDEDCLKEGILQSQFDDYWFYGFTPSEGGRLFKSPREAFAVLIDKVSGKGTWERNEWTFCYSFKLIQ